MSNALTIGIAGGSGSGKTTIAKMIIDAVGKDRISHLQMDAYYSDLSHLPHQDRAQQNFDHPSSLDIELFAEHIETLRRGVDIEVPQYDFVEHCRTNNTTKLAAKAVIFLEGILLLENPQVRKQIDIKIYVETPADIRFIRRLNRDIEERGRSTDCVIKQYYKTVRPMHQEFVKPCREYADIIIPWQGYNEVPAEMIIHRIEAFLKQKSLPQDSVFDLTQADNKHINN